MHSSVHQMEETLVATLIQLIVIILAARIAGNAAAAVRQPRVVGEIIAGLLLGPSFLTAAFPEASATIFNASAAPSVQILSQIGLVLLMFQIGSDFEFGHLRTQQNRKAAVFVSVASVFAPLCVGFALGRLTAPVLAPGIDPLIYSLFVAIALAITAVPVLGRILREYSLTRSDTGVIAISAAAANDVVGWILLAGITAFASAQLSMANSALQLVGLLILAAGFWYGGRPLVDWLLRRMPISEGQIPAQLVAIVLAAVFAAGIVTQKLGIFTIFGGFMLGLLFHRHREFVETWQRQVGKFILVFFLPIFFTCTGLRTNIFGLDSLSDWSWCAAIFLAAVASKVMPVYLASRLAGLSPEKSATIGVSMNTRGLMELIVLNIGLDLGFIPQDVFTMLVIMAVGTTIMTGPLLKRLLRRSGHPLPTLVEA
ncbi:cation:proton antiporter [Sphingomonas cavernae]|uniref:Potassium transporter Kef n=1 Tax=Sphingomonas cavernae TaxID=2320861 RepID=A0A418WLS2_9SPHN|nr:cation:proton antiporter [Sphingomonas cavernae]RJF90829.1 potassium transporter Kef [Sphingomonas cavernae]